MLIWGPSNLVESRPLVIAVDGPAASGKGTLARRLAEYFGLRHLDTGSLYRAVGLKLLKNNNDPADGPLAEAAARDLQEDDLTDPRLREDTTATAASLVAAQPRVRAVLLAYQRAFAQQLPGAVLDGRDIGTVVCPDATAKIYLDASVEVRAARRAKELQVEATESIESRVLSDMIERDSRDRKRDVAPLKVADDACVIDTTGLGPDDVFDRAQAFVSSRRG